MSIANHPSRAFAAPIRFAAQYKSTYEVPSLQRKYPAVTLQDVWDPKASLTRNLETYQAQLNNAYHPGQSELSQIQDDILEKHQNAILPSLVPLSESEVITPSISQSGTPEPVNQTPPQDTIAIIEARKEAVQRVFEKARDDYEDIVSEYNQAKGKNKKSLAPLVESSRSVLNKAVEHLRQLNR